MCFSFTMLAPFWCCNLCANDHLQQCSLFVFSQFWMSSFLIFWIFFCFVLLLLLCCDVGFYFSLLGALLLHLVLQLVHRWSFLTMFIVYFFVIFGEVFPHFLDYVLLHIFCCVMMSTFFFFPLIDTLFCIGVVTSTLVIITNSACC